ncbi:hypothetical protein [Phenylobacterium sp.]|uniref:hypothetical protein n=1 Tax=Phenylobacterium sp. TaxID=1871053 RepID=UPI0028970534|nr:hypothetical protein [Phenylobacterium sp.]
MYRSVAVLLLSGCLALGGCQRQPEFAGGSADGEAAPAAARSVPGLDQVSARAFAYAEARMEGRVDLDAYRSGAMRVFAGLDRNGDMVLDPAEQPPAPEGAVSAPLSAQVFNRALAGRFEAADRNGDGVLDPEERSALTR